MKIPENIKFILQKLNNSGYESYLVGGCVRNSLLNISIKDYDVATDAVPNKIMEIFKDCTTVSVGKKFGTVVVVINDENIEVTTYRKESGYTDGRHPENVFFSTNIEDDLSRRDFTVNAMAYNEKRGLIDLYGGVSDLKNKILRTVGNPRNRIREDYLRIMRMIRFSATLGFKPEEDLLNVCREEKNGIKKISKERIASELNNILISDNVKYGFDLLKEIEMLGIILPEIQAMVGFDQKNGNHNLDLYEHSLNTVSLTKPDLITRIAALFHDTGKLKTFKLNDRGEFSFIGHEKVSGEIAKKILKSYNYSNYIKDNVVLLINAHMCCLNTYTKKSIRKLLRKLGEENVIRLFDLQTADIMSTVNKNLENIENGKRILNEVISEKNPIFIKDMKINGKDLISLGYPEGKEIGLILRKLNEKVLENPELNEYSVLLKLAEDLGEELYNG